MEFDFIVDIRKFEVVLLLDDDGKLMIILVFFELNFEIEENI